MRTKAGVVEDRQAGSVKGDSAQVAAQERPGAATGAPRKTELEAREDSPQEPLCPALPPTARSRAEEHSANAC